MAWLTIDQLRVLPGELDVSPELHEALAVCERVLSQDRAFCDRLGASTVVLDDVTIAVDDGESPQALGERLAREVRARALGEMQSAEQEYEQAVVTEVTTKLAGGEAAGSGAGKPGLFARLGRGVLKLFRWKSKKSETELALSLAQKKELAARVEAAEKAKQVAFARFAAATGLSLEDLQKLVGERGGVAAVDAVSDTIIDSGRFDASYATLQTDPIGFYDRNGAAVTGRVLRRELARRKGVPTDELAPAEIEEFARAHQFMAVTHLANRNVVPMILGSGTLMAGRHSGGYVWFGNRHLEGPANLRQRMSTTLGLQAVKMMSYLNDSIPLVVPTARVLGPGQALETGGEGAMNRAGYAVKGFVQQSYAKGLGLPAGAHKGEIKLFPQGVGFNDADIDAVKHVMAGGVNSGTGRVAQLATLGVLGLILLGLLL